MKRIVKTHAPPELSAWREENREHNHSYADLLGTEAHVRLKERLLSEQGWLCAYTGRAISEKASHIEHIKPQTVCAEWEDVEYRNVVACFPADGGDTSHGYGAPVKGGWWAEHDFISPLTEECDRRYQFVWSGRVQSTPQGHQAANRTIDVLQLNNNDLRGLRKSRIDGFFGFGAKTSMRPLSLADARKALANIDRVDANGRLREFCFVLKQLLPKYIQQGR